jgi:hypothetical protein
MYLARGLQVSEDEVFAVARGRVLTEPEGPQDFGVLFYGWEDASEEERAATLDAIRRIAESFQMRRQRKPPDKGKGKGKGKK